MHHSAFQELHLLNSLVLPEKWPLHILLPALDVLYLGAELVLSCAAMVCSFQGLVLFSLVACHQ